MTGAAANLASLQAYATATANATSSLFGSVAVINGQLSDLFTSGTNAPVYLYLRDNITGLTVKLYVNGGTFTVSPA
jgi:hypothetical protein